MSELHEFPQGHRLQFLSSHNQRYVAAYLTLMQVRRYAPGTLERFIDTLKSFCQLLPASCHDRIVADFTCITPDDIDAWLQTAYQKGRAPSTLRTALSTLRRFFAFLRAEGALARQPIRTHRHQVIVPDFLPRPMAEDDLVRFFEVIDVFRDRVMFLLMLRCGLRLEEVRVLTWSAIDWDQGTIRIDNSKGQVDRVVYVSPDLEEALHHWQAVQPSGAHYVFPSRFQRRAGQPISRRLISRCMSQYVQRAQLTSHYTPHCLRHYPASRVMPST